MLADPPVGIAFLLAGLSPHSLLSFDALFASTARSLNIHIRRCGYRYRYRMGVPAGPDAVAQEQQHQPPWRRLPQGMQTLHYHTQLHRLELIWQ